MGSVKNRRILTHNIPVPTAHEKMADNDMQSADNPQNLVAGQQNVLAGWGLSTLCGDSEYKNARRKSKRFRTNGIVALTSLEKPVVSNIYDIAPGGVSFLHVNETEVSNSEFKMDILLFDSLVGFEYFIGQVKGRVIWKELVSDPENNEPIWRFNVQFLDLDTLRESKLRILCNPDQTANAWFLDDRLPKISYGS